LRITPTRRSRLRPLKIALPALLLVAAALLPTASADTPDTDPALPPFPPTWVTQGSGYDPTVTTVQRAELAVAMPELVMRSDMRVCTYDGAHPNTGYPSCTPEEAKAAHADWNIKGLLTSGDLFVRSPDGAGQRYGQFPSVQVRNVAFGSIPIEATVTLRQTRDRSDHLIPITFTFSYALPGPPPGTVVKGYEQYGPAPGLKPTNPVICRASGGTDCVEAPDFSTGLVGSGPVQISLANIRVDGVPMPVGSQCSAPAQLTLHTAGGWYYGSYFAGNLEIPGLAESLLRTPGTAYEFNPFFAPGYAHGNAAIGAFHGCHNGTEDVSRLITSMVSGPTNPVETTMTIAMGADWCYDYPKCPAP
jgi:hypothetical protein